MHKICLILINSRLNFDIYLNTEKFVKDQYHSNEGVLPKIQFKYEAFMYKYSEKIRRIFGENPMLYAGMKQWKPNEMCNHIE